MKRSLEETVEHGEHGGFESEPDEEELLGQKADKNRERNREHAKRTRLRKKEMIEGMKMRLLELQREAVELEQLLEESSTANILMGMGDKSSPSSGDDESGSFKVDAGSDDKSKLNISKGNIVDQLRQRVRAEAAKTRDKKPKSSDGNDSSAEGGATVGTLTSGSGGEEGPECTSNENSSYDQTNDNGENCSTNEEDASDGASSSSNNKWSATTRSVLASIDELTREEAAANSVSLISTSSSGAPPEVENRRERNRMHAKLTRDRKKLFTSRMQQLIQTLERHNMVMRGRLSNMIQGRSAAANAAAAAAAAAAVAGLPTSVGPGGSVSSGSDMSSLMLPTLPAANAAAVAAAQQAHIQAQAHAAQAQAQAQIAARNVMVAAAAAANHNHPFMNGGSSDGMAAFLGYAPSTSAAAAASYQQQ